MEENKSTLEHTEGEQSNNTEKLESLEQEIITEEEESVVSILQSWATTVIEFVKPYIEKVEIYVKENPIFVKGALTGAVISTLIILVVGTLSGALNILNIGNSKVVTSDVMKKIQLIDSAMDKYFLYDIDEEVLVDMIYAGYVVGLGDDYSAYYNEAATKALLESTSGEYSGVGAMLSQSATTGVVTVSVVYDGTPSKEAGLLEGDVIIEVDGIEIAGEDLTDVIARIKGEEGTKVELTILRGESQEKHILSMVRKVVETTTVEYEMLSNKIGYIMIDQFDQVTTAQFKTALESLKNEGMERVIFDLRNNPGGSLSVVCDMLDMIVSEGLLVYTEDKNGNRAEKNASSEESLDMPMAVLVNAKSASASEIFAGAIQDYELGPIVGETTYGKGVVQQLIDLRDGTMLKLTISEYFTALGRNIHGIGIEPDVVVEQSIDDVYDKQLQTAIKEVGKINQ